MNRHSEKIQHIKKLLVEATEFNSIFKEFFDFIDAEPDFIELGKKYKSSAIKTVLETVCQEVFHTNCTITHFKLLLIQSEQFVHGSCLIGGRVAAVIYCPDMEMGMVAVTQAPFSSQMYYARFSTTVVGDADPACLHHPPTRTVQ